MQFKSQRLLALSARYVFPLLVAGVAAGCASKDGSQSNLYKKPLLSPGAQFAAVPVAVQNTIRAETGSSAIENIEKETGDGRIVYHVFFENNEFLPPLLVASDGSLLDRDRMVAIGAPIDHPNVIVGGPVSGISLNDLPAAVIKAIQHRAPDAQLDSIVKSVQGDQTTYLIGFKDHVHPTLQLASDGSVLNERGP